MLFTFRGQKIQIFLLQEADLPAKHSSLHKYTNLFTVISLAVAYCQQVLVPLSVSARTFLEKGHLL
ncbi:UNVERIFIED_CONTAM: hypothetical protein FKN15_071337 [Acipenser sinensis]